MALSCGSAVKTFIETLGLGVPVFHDLPANKVNRPYVVVHDALGVKLETLHGPDIPHVGVEIVQVDLFANYRDPASGQKQDNPTLAATLQRGLHGARIPPFGTTNALVYACLVRNVTRLVELPGDIVGYHLTLHVWREL